MSWLRVPHGFPWAALLSLDKRARLHNGRGSSLLANDKAYGITNVELHLLLEHHVNHGLHVSLRIVSCYGASFRSPMWNLIAYAGAGVESESVARFALGHYRRMVRGEVEVGYLNAEEHNSVAPDHWRLAPDLKFWFEQCSRHRPRCKFGSGSRHKPSQRFQSPNQHQEPASLTGRRITERRFAFEVTRRSGRELTVRNSARWSGERLGEGGRSRRLVQRQRAQDWVSVNRLEVTHPAYAYEVSDDMTIAYAIPMEPTPVLAPMVTAVANAVPFKPLARSVPIRSTCAHKRPKVATEDRNTVPTALL